MHIEEVMVPLLKLPPSKNYRLRKWLINDGSRVTTGQAIFELEIGDTLFEIESFDTGIIKIKTTENTKVEISQIVAEIVCEGTPETNHTYPVELRPEDISYMDSQRGNLSRASWLAAITQEAIASHRKS